MSPWPIRFELRRSGGWLPSTAEVVLDLLFPPRCVYCAADLDGLPREVLLCDLCRRQLAPPPAPACLRCGAPLPPGFAPPRRCRHCKHRRLAFSSVTYLGKYEAHLRRAVLWTKSPRHELLAATLADLLWHRQRHELSALRPEVIVSVPMFWGRRLWRGANSAEVVARTLAGRLEVPFCPMLARRRNTLPQAGLTPPARFENVRGAFSFRRDFNCLGARVLLVDDILTTGATCGEAAKVLRRHGAKSVAVAVLARADAPQRT